MNRDALVVPLDDARLPYLDLYGVFSEDPYVAIQELREQNDGTLHLARSQRGITAGASAKATSGNTSCSQFTSRAPRQRAASPVTTQSNGGSVFATTTSPERSTDSSFRPAARWKLR